MNIIVHRQHFGETFTISKMFFDGEDIGIFVLEDKYREVEGQPVKEWKVQNETAIPKGKYKLIFDFSNRFQRIMPHILDVEGFEGVENSTQEIVRPIPKGVLYWDLIGMVNLTGYLTLKKPLKDSVTNWKTAKTLR